MQIFPTNFVNFVTYVNLRHPSDETKKVGIPISQKEKQNKTKKKNKKKTGSFGNEEKSFYSMVLRVYEYIIECYRV